MARPRLNLVIGYTAAGAFVPLFIGESTTAADAAFAGAAAQGCIAVEHFRFPQAAKHREFPANVARVAPVAALVPSAESQPAAPALDTSAAPDAAAPQPISKKRKKD